MSAVIVTREGHPCGQVLVEESEMLDTDVIYIEGEEAKEIKEAPKRGRPAKAK